LRYIRTGRLIKIPVGATLLNTLNAKNWIETRVSGQGIEIRVTAAGLEALRTKQ
jgi:hypothetical protein